MTFVPLTQEEVQSLESEIDDYFLFQPILNELNAPLLIHRIETGIWNSRLESVAFDTENFARERTATGKLIRAYDWLRFFDPQRYSCLMR